MAKGRYLFSSEVVFPGHPDKVADQISDGVLDAHLRGDPRARVACETVVAPQFVAIVGEITSRATVDAEKIARDTIRSIGYTDPALGFDATNAQVIVRLVPQSADIARGVDAETSEDHDQGAGDQGMMFGYAATETPELMPAPIMFARRLAHRHREARKGEIPWLRPDGKCQVTLEYDGIRPIRIDTVVFSAQTAPKPIEEVRAELAEKVVRRALPAEMMDKRTRILVNPTGIFEKGGPAADSGLTGRKIIVDTYGGAAPHGGGAFSGKDPSKVDRSAAYAARWVAKNVVAAGLAERCTVQVAYAIGVAQPVSILVDTAGTSTVDEEKIRAAVAKVFDLRPRAITERLDLLRPIYQQTAREGHFGCTGDAYTWERTDRVEELKRAVGAGAAKAERSNGQRKPAAKPKSGRAKAKARA